MRYPTDLTDRQWSFIVRFFKSGNRSKYNKITLVNAVLYLIKTGCQWRMLPNDFPPHQTIHSFFRRTRLKGIWKIVLHVLTALTRSRAEKNPNPTYCLIDSQSTKTTSASEERGIDGGKKIKGRKRHIVTDTLGNILAVVVHAASIHDTVASIMALRKAFESYPSLKGFVLMQGIAKHLLKMPLNWGYPLIYQKKSSPGNGKYCRFVGLSNALLLGKTTIVAFLKITK